jgi:hypothetical protein
VTIQPQEAPAEEPGVEEPEPNVPTNNTTGNQQAIQERHPRNRSEEVPPPPPVPVPRPAQMQEPNIENLKEYTREMRLRRFANQAVN